MAELPPPDAALEALYETDRAIPLVDDALAERLLRRIEGAAAAGAVAAAAGSAGTVSTAAAGAKAVTLKTAMAIAALSFAGGAMTGAGALWASMPSERSAPAPVDESARAPVPDEEPPEPAESGVEPPRSEPPGREPPGREPTVEHEGREIAERHAGGPTGLDTAATNRPDAPERPIGPEVSLAEERRLLEAARAALARGRAGDAQAQLARHRSRFGAGQLVEERQSLEVEAAVAAGRYDDAVARGERFLARRPTSLYAGRVRRLVAEAREHAHASPVSE